MLVQVNYDDFPDRVAPVASTLKHDEFSDIAALRGLMERGYRPPVIFDVGAAIGSWTSMAKQFWPASNYFLFEVLEERRTVLEALRETEGGSLNVLIGGVGHFDGMLSLGVTDSLYDSSFAYDGSRSREVACARLETLHKQGKIPKPNFLKMDVQGFERNVLDGSGAVLSECSVVLMECQFFKFCESMSTLDKTIQYMSDIGFVPYEFVNFLRRPLDNAMGQCDLIFVKRNHWLISDLKWG